MGNKQQHDDFLQPLLDMMDRRMDTLEHKIDANTVTTNKTLEQARYTNGRVTKAEANIIELQKQSGRKLNFNPNIIYLLAIAFVLLLAIVASILHIQIGGIL